jgi:signal transduction histidine kinase
VSLRWKLFVSYGIVVIVGSLILTVSTALIAPVTFAGHIASMGDMMRGNVTNMMHTEMQELNAELDVNFRQSLNSALLLATIAATVAASVVSLYVSQRIVHPIQATVSASQRIAAGDYTQRLIVYGEDELGELAHSFNRMAQSLADTESMRQQLIADVSHELKTPLASIAGYMEGLQDGVLPAEPETFRQVQREADRLQRLVHDLQELSRAEAGQIPLNIQPHDVTQLVRSAVDWLRPQFEDQQVDLVLSLPDESLEILADYDRIRQVLLNLLGNALQYTPNGGCVTAGWKRIGAMVNIFIQDTGVGLSTEDHERIFQRFYRVDKSRSRGSGGSGIGLTIAHHFVVAHHGEIWVESSGIGQGSTFHFTLAMA